MNRWPFVGLLLTVAVALWLRGGDLAERPLHNDEAINAFKLRELWRSGVYRYDPHEYHGPTLYYLALPVLGVAALVEPDQPGEAAMRALPVLVGVALILLLLFVADGLSRWALWFAGVFTAVSPAMVYFSRYYIHELLLVGFTALLLAALWRYHRRPGVGWAAMAGGAVALMFATKETFVFNLAALGGAAGVSLAWRLGARDGMATTATTATAARPGLRAWVGRWAGAVGASLRAVPCRHLGVALAVGVGVFVVAFSSGFTHPAGPLDAFRSYVIWGERAGGASPHVHPWYFYFQRLWWFRVGGGPRWTEGVLLALALVGAVGAFRRGVARSAAGSNGGGQGKAWEAADPGLVRFLSVYTVGLATIYAVIPYKTPWCLLGFQHGLIVLAGIGAATLLGRVRGGWVRGGVALVLAGAVGHLAWQAWRASREFAADFRNPHVYGHTSADIVNLLEQIRGLAAVHPLGDGMPLEVMAPDSNYWPLPWYLRRFEHTGWWDHLPDRPSAPVIVAATKLQAGLEEKTNHAWRQVGMFELRPRYFVELYVENSLWRRFLDAQ